MGEGRPAGRGEGGGGEGAGALGSIACVCPGGEKQRGLLAGILPPQGRALGRRAQGSVECLLCPPP